MATDVPLLDLINTSIESNKAALSHPDFQTLLSDTSLVVDVVMTIPVMGNEAAYYVSKKKNASLVLYTTVPYILPWIANAVGNPVHPAYMPLPFFPFKQNMNFQERFINSLALFGISLGRTYFVLPKIEQMILEVFPSEKNINLGEMIESSALTINLGSPFLGDGLRPVLSNTIQAGLMSCSPGKPLEGELKDWVEGAEHGVIYLSFGSVVRASKMPESRRHLFMSVLGKLKQRVIWKWEKPMKDAPSNVLISSWLPQTDVLAHPNVKLFITHGGAGSIQETICHKTPVVGIPIGGDQLVNLAEAITKNLGVVINWREVTEETLMNAISRVLGNPSYQESVENLQNMILDRPIHPLDNAVWWLEYLLRHPKNPEMRSPVLDLYWFQYYLLDVFAVLVSAMLVAIFILVKCFKCFIRRCKKEKTD